VSAEQKDFWDKVAVFMHPLGGLLTALAVAFVGVLGSQVLNRRQAADTNARLYSELMSRREESESSLRKDMFVSIIQPFLQPKEGDLDTRVLNLELLAVNFHDSLNLKPLFLDLQRRLAVAKIPERDAYLDRVNRVAREITAKQLFALEGHGQSFRRTVDLEEFDKTGRFGVPLDGESIDVEGRRCNGVRCAVTMSAFTPQTADLTTICFPGEYASLKDRPYYDEVIQKLQKAAGTDTDGTPRD
jgi:hypothetical protein